MPATAADLDLTGHPLSDGRPPAWACQWGEDEFGVWAAFRVKEVTHRMRWIPPGTFRMGSPEDEVGRFEREGPRHLVTITSGFWLGETPCPQSLWVAVTGEGDESARLGPPDAPGTPGPWADRPVNRVTWHDCRAFCSTLGELLGDAGWRLPTEAQWERACRAGTEEATYAGEWTTAEDAAAVLDGIAWYRSNSDGTIQPVGRKAPNPWGLHDMLGNVFEWCGDGFRTYGSGPVVDPGLDAGRDSGVSRVVQGGVVVRLREGRPRGVSPPRRPR